MESPLRRALRFFYRRFLPRPARNALQIELALLRPEPEPSRVEAPAASRVLVLAPHMDDEVFGCGGTLAQCVARGSRVDVVYLTDGSKGIDWESREAASAEEMRSAEARLVETRKREARRAGEVLGLAEPIFLDLPDGALEVGEDAVARLAEALGSAAPEVVFLPFLTDSHADHWTTNGLLLEAAARAGLSPRVSLWGYEIWQPLVPNAVVDITQVMDLKRKAMAEFASQMQPIDYSRVVAGLNAYRSVFTASGQGFAEAFFTAELGVYRGIHAAAVRRRS